MGTTRKRLECRPIGQNQEDGVKLTLPRFRKDPHPLLGDPTPGVPKKNGNAIVPRHDHQQNSGTLTDEAYVASCFGLDDGALQDLGTGQRGTPGNSW